MMQIQIGSTYSIKGKMLFGEPVDFNYNIRIMRLIKQSDGEIRYGGYNTTGDRRDSVGVRLFRSPAGQFYHKGIRVEVEAK